MNSEPVIHEIVGVSKTHITLRSWRGKKWDYKFNDRLDQSLIQEMEKRKNEGWDVLGFAEFKPINDKLLSLTEVCL